MPGAQRSIGTPSSQWVLHAWHGCQAPGELWAFSDREAASFWVKQFKSDPISMADLRALALQYGSGSSVRRSGDDQVLEELSWLLSRGVLHVHRVPARRTAWRIVSESASAPADLAPAPRPTPSQSAAPLPTPKPVEEADTFFAGIDAAATAAVLQSASVSGVPFCEECAKAAAAARDAA